MVSLAQPRPLLAARDIGDSRPSYAKLCGHDPLKGSIPEKPADFDNVILCKLRSAAPTAAIRGLVSDAIRLVLCLGFPRKVSGRNASASAIPALMRGMVNRGRRGSVDALAHNTMNETAAPAGARETGATIRPPGIRPNQAPSPAISQHAFLEKPLSFAVGDASRHGVTPSPPSEVMGIAPATRIARWLAAIGNRAYQIISHVERSMLPWLERVVEPASSDAFAFCTRKSGTSP